eukprot:CAMPEP_0183474538 /NCGR_PEP_ID=MMETSP0370-20130417/163256_1 /TAXON_ID=268820 /ORGANISM="Peridinium aciculiferum, Strain PAER-2" /LENGTH=61 /DNA_ID=CAMNT_0025667275 /DNA_START=154 /DNA_END=335 /DNA_ORIENTATION=-
MAHGVAFSEAMMREITRGLGLEPERFGLLVAGAGGIGEVANGIYTQQGTFHAKPFYKNDRG